MVRPSSVVNVCHEDGSTTATKLVRVNRKKWPKTSLFRIQEKIASFTRFLGPTKINILIFLVADTQLYKRLCPSVRPSVRRSVSPSVHPSVRPSVLLSIRRSVMIKLKSGKTRISAPAHPSATGGRVSGLGIISFVLHLYDNTTSCGRVDRGGNARF